MFISLLSSLAFCQTKVAILPVIDKYDQIIYAHKLLLRSNITTAITNTSGYEGYDRIDLSSVMNEQDFQRKGLVSDNEIHKIGEMTGADFVLIAEAAKLDEAHIIASAKIVNVESAKITNSAQEIVDINDLKQMADNCMSLTNTLLGQSISNKPSVIPFSKAEVKPLFMGGNVNGFYSWASQRISYPEWAVENNIKGEVTIGFTIEIDGSVTDIKVEKSSGEYCLDQEVFRVVSSSPKWTPAMQGGKPIPVRINWSMGFMGCR